jgi:hypothetical protein
MSEINFMTALKSTIDKKAKALAESLNVQYVDLDDTTATSELFKTSDSAIVFELSTFQQNPIDPLYSGTLHIGARTVLDPGNYEILQLVGQVSSLFKEGVRIPIRESFEVLESGVVGVMLPGNAVAMPQQYELLSGIRLVSLDFTAQRLV